MRASENSADDRRRFLRGYEIKKRQYNPAPCAPALFISPPACSASVTPARLPTPHINSKQRLDGYARVAFEAPNPPGLALCNPRDVYRPMNATYCNLQVTGILISARTEVGQELNDRLRIDRNLTTVCQRAVFARGFRCFKDGKMS